LKQSINTCLNSRDFEQKTYSFRKQVMLDLFRLDRSIQSIDSSDRKILSNIIQKNLASENKEFRESVEKKQKQCEKDLMGEAKRAGFKDYEEFDKHLTIH
jgi:hypothetical protein